MPAYALEELAGSPSLTIDRKGALGTRTFKMPWGDRYLPLADFLPDPYLTGEDIFIPPAATFPGLDTLVVDKVKIDPLFPENMVGDGVFPANYDYAKLVVEYRTQQYDQKSSQVQPNGPGGSSGSTGQQKTTFVTHKVTVSAEFLTWPNGVLTYNGTGDPSAAGAPGSQAKVPEDQKFAVLLPLIEHHITWHFVPYPPWSSIRWLMGNVNAYWFAGSPPETLLFAGCEADREVTNQGVQTWSLTYKFLEKNLNQMDPSSAFGWNHYLRTNGWNSGAFQIVNRKCPSVYTTLTQALAIAVAPGFNFTVRSRSAWPRGAQPEGMYARIDNEYFLLTTGPAGNQLQVVQGARLGSASANHAIGAVLQTGQAAAQNLAMDNATTALTIKTTSPDSGNDSRAVFPQVGQFFVRVGNELMSVVRRSSADPYTFGVLRGVRGTLPTPHGSNSVVFQADAPIYPLGDFRYLFLSGLVVF